MFGFLAVLSFVTRIQCYHSTLTVITRDSVTRLAPKFVSSPCLPLKFFAAFGTEFRISGLIELHFRLPYFLYSLREALTLCNTLIVDLVSCFDEHSMCILHVIHLIHLVMFSPSDIRISILFLFNFPLSSLRRRSGHLQYLPSTGHFNVIKFCTDCMTSG